MLPLLYGIATNEFSRYLDAFPLRWSPKHCVSIVATSPGYPEHSEKGKEISGIDKLQEWNGIEDKEGTRYVFFSGVSNDGSSWKTSSGSVFTLSATAHSLSEARKQVLKALQWISFEGVHFRRGIGSSLSQDFTS